MAKCSYVKSQGRERKREETEKERGARERERRERKKEERKKERGEKERRERRERERREIVVVGGHINSSNRLHQANSAGCEKFATFSLIGRENRQTISHIGRI